MNGAKKAACGIAALLVLFALTAVPAKAQFGGGQGGGDMMTQMAPMLNMMKAKMGKRRFGQMMQTMGPMMSGMMENGGGGFGGMTGGFGGGSGFAPQGYGMGGGDFMGMLGGAGGGDMMSMIPQLMQMGHFGGGGYGHHRRHRHR
jgi:hypothetical protein